MNSSDKTHYLIYKITNLINGKIYIGQHRTTDVNDGYMGSGVLLKEEQIKYGMQNFKKEILFECSSQYELSAKEADIVNDEFVARNDTYNLVKGGSFVLSHGEASKSGLAGSMALQQKLKHNPQFSERVRKKMHDSMKRIWKEHPEKFKNFRYDWTGRHHSEETKRKMSEKGKLRLGEKNNAFGKIWIHNEIVKMSIMVDRNKLVYYLNQCWELGRVCNWDKYIERQKRLSFKVNVQTKTNEPDKNVSNYTNRYNEYNRLLPIFLRHKWKQFVELTGYKYSNQNFHRQVEVLFGFTRPTLKLMKKRVRKGGFITRANPF